MLWLFLLAPILWMPVLDTGSGDVGQQIGTVTGETRLEYPTGFL